MTVAARPGVALLHRCPDSLGKYHAMRLEILLRRVSAHEVMIEVLGGLDLGYHLVDPFVGNMTIRTGCANAGPVLPVDRAFQLLEWGVTHLVTGDAEGLRIGQFECPVEG